MITVRFIGKQFVHICSSLLVLAGLSIINNAHADTAYWYKGPWVIYEDWEHVHILVETNRGVDNDYNHRRLHFTYDDSCNEPNWGYDHDDIIIDGGKDRRLWTLWAHNLTPGCRYTYHFKFRRTWADVWSSVAGSFTAGSKGVPSKGEFYAFGDQKYYGSKKDEIEKIAGEIMSDNGDKTFILHTGDIVYQGGYYFAQHDEWWDYFRNKNMRRMFASMIMFPAPGNHDVQYGSGSYTDVDSWNYTRYFPYSVISHNARKAHYHRRYGQFHIYSLTCYPMDTNNFCSDKNANFRPKDQGGTGQYEWLEDELKSTADDPRQWKIVIMHVPMYAPEYCPNHDALTFLKPLFERYGVDLVLTGHEHYYARKTVNDIPYLILGGGGAGLGLSKDSPCRTDPQCDGFDYVANKHHFVHFIVKGDIMTGYVHWDNDFGGLIESFTVDRTPKANFDCAPEAGPVDTPVTFTDTSTGNRYKYEWDFGDGSPHVTGTGSDASTEHTYTAEGKYTVTLTVTSAYESDTKTCTQCVHVGPMADFDATPLEGAAPLTVNFQDKSDGYVSSWLWDFGDGATSAKQNPAHRYNENGPRTVRLTVSNNGVSNTKTKGHYVKVEPYALYNYKMDRTCIEWDSTDLSCRIWVYHANFTNLSQGNDVTYDWDFGDGHTSTEESPSHTYSYSGAKARLTVTDGAGLTDYMTKYIEVGSGIPPEAIEIDIMPEDDSNIIEISDKGWLWPEVIPVAILSNASFDAFGLDTDTITFGRTGNEVSLVNCDTELWDVNGDGYRDLVCRFEARQTGFRIGDKEGILRAVTITDWRLMEGKDYVQIEEFQDPIHR